MIDVMFFLLVTFMLASLSMQSLNSIPVDLPQGDAPNLQHQEPVTLTITKDSQIFLDKTPTTLDTHGVRAQGDAARTGSGSGRQRRQRRAGRDRGAGDAPGAPRRSRAFSDRGQARMNGAVQTRFAVPGRAVAAAGLDCAAIGRDLGRAAAWLFTHAQADGAAAA